MYKRQQQDYGYKPTAGCVPMLLNFLVIFGVIGVVYNPLQRIFHISAAALASAGEALTAAGVSFTAITRDTNIIAPVSYTHLNIDAQRFLWYTNLVSAALLKTSMEWMFLWILSRTF